MKNRIYKLKGRVFAEAGERGRRGTAEHATVLFEVDKPENIVTLRDIELEAMHFAGRHTVSYDAATSLCA